MALSTRIKKETEKLAKELPQGITATPTVENLRYFKIKMNGPSETPYEKGVFNLELFLPGDYPMVPPPKVRFLTKIYHPNIDRIGAYMPGYTQR